MEITKKYDYYKEVQDLIVRLKNMQLNVYVESLQAAITNGSTGNEIVMALRWNLKKIIKDRKCTGVVLVKSKRLFNELNKILK